MFDGILSDVSHSVDRPYIAIIRDEKQCAISRVVHILGNRLGNNLLHIVAAQTDPETIPQLLDQADGLLFMGRRTGVDPREYGDDPDPARKYDVERDRFSLPLAKEALLRGIPTSGICGGAGELQVASGGKLQRNLPELFGASAHDLAYRSTRPDRDELSRIVHTVEVLAGGKFEKTFGAGHLFGVPSMHTQGIISLAPGLRAEGIDPATGVVEAFIHEDHPHFMGVYFHPEWVSMGSEPIELNFVFASLSDAVKAHRQDRKNDFGHHAARPLHHPAADALCGAEMILAA